MHRHPSPEAERNGVADLVVYGRFGALHLLYTLHGLPVGFALTGAKADERVVLCDILHADPDLTGRHGRRRQVMIGDKSYFGAEFEAALPQGGIELLRPARKGEAERPGARFFKPLRQIIESINDTLKLAFRTVSLVWLVWHWLAGLALAVPPRGCDSFPHWPRTGALEKICPIRGVVRPAPARPHSGDLIRRLSTTRVA